MPGNFHSVPPSIIAQWPTPNYEHPRVRRGWLPALSCTLLGFSTVLVATRLYLRARKQAGTLGLDDLFIFVGWFVSVGFSTSGVIDSEWYSIDVHTWDVPPDEYVGAALTGFIAQVLFLASTCATKTSVLLFYRRMAKHTYSKNWLHATWAALCFTALYFVGVLLAYCLMCTPLDAYWLSYDPEYDTPFKCLNGNILSPFVGVLSVVSDVYAVLLPCIWLHRYNLHVTKRQRIALDIVFALGTIVAGCGIARTYYLWEINHTYDTSWTGFDLFMWSLLECHLAIIFACAPSLRAFVRRYVVGSWRGSSRSTNRKDANLSSEKDTSTAYSTVLYRDPELGNPQDLAEQRVLTKPSYNTIGDNSQGERLETWLSNSSSRTQSSEIVPVIRTADEYEAYAIGQLSRYSHKAIGTSENAVPNLSKPANTYHAR